MVRVQCITTQYNPMHTVERATDDRAVAAVRTITKLMNIIHQTHTTRESQSGLWAITATAEVADNL